jgi:hypothetical protein
MLTLKKRKYSRYKPKEVYTNDIAKVCEIKSYGKSTLIVRSSKSSAISQDNVGTSSRLIIKQLEPFRRISF